MRVILSRKGFDSGYGGYPSPILPNGTLLSLPIPSPGDGICYSDLQYQDSLSYFDLMMQLKPRVRIPNRGSSPLTPDTECHLDPDLKPDVIKRMGDWRPLFGQLRQSQTHLRNQDVGVGDLFLFFGWFRQTEWWKGTLCFKRDAPDLHVIHGYLQVDEVLQPETVNDVPTWMRYHPHVANQSRLSEGSNAIYVARRRLSWNPKMVGAAPLVFDPKLVLTKEGRSRSIWRLPQFMRSLKISYHSSRSWHPDGSFSSAKIGQEFVIESSPEADEWARNLIT